MEQEGEGRTGMSRLVDADALMKEFAEFVKDSNNSDFADVPTWNDAVSLVGSAPTIEPERKTGRWIHEKEMQCSCCGFTCDDPYYLGAANYCPECGVKMEGYDED